MSTTIRQFLEGFLRLTGMHQKTVAQALGLSEKTISDYLNERGSPRSEKLLVLACLGILMVQEGSIEEVRRRAQAARGDWLIAMDRSEKDPLIDQIIASSVASGALKLSVSAIEVVEDPDYIGREDAAPAKPLL